MSTEIYLILLLLASHVFWFAFIVDVDRRVIATVIILVISMIIYMVSPNLIRCGALIQVVFYIGALISIYYIKMEDK
jgi:hypothetical protein